MIKRRFGVKISLDFEPIVKAECNDVKGLDDIFKKIKKKFG